MRIGVILAIVAMIAGAATAAEASPISEICYSPDLGAQAAPPPDNDTRFACPVAGNLTLVELAQQGYRLVRLWPVVGSAPSSVRQQLLVQREVRVHASGFEQ